MSGTRYVPQPVVDDARDEVRAGRTIDDIANRLGIDSTILAQLLGKPMLRPVLDLPADYLWRSDELDGVL